MENEVTTGKPWIELRREWAVTVYDADGTAADEECGFANQRRAIEWAQESAEAVLNVDYPLPVLRKGASFLPHPEDNE